MYFFNIVSVSAPYVTNEITHWWKTFLFKHISMSDSNIYSHFPNDAHVSHILVWISCPFATPNGYFVSYKFIYSDTLQRQTRYFR